MFLKTIKNAARHYVISVDLVEIFHFINTNYVLAQIMSVLMLVSIYFLFSSKKVTLLLIPGIFNFLIGVFTDQGVKQKYF